MEVRRRNVRSRQKQVRLGSSEVDCLVERYRGGATVDGLAGCFGVDRTTVMAHLRRRRVPTRRREKLLGADDVAEAAVRYAAGATLAEVAGVFAVGVETLRSAFVDAGVARRSRGRQPG